MHCRDWEERLALHVGGDLPAAKAAEVERHLAECGPCQGFWSGMKESLELLEEIHAEPLVPACYTAVRGRVMAEIQSRRVWWRRPPARPAPPATRRERRGRPPRPGGPRLPGAG